MAVNLSPFNYPQYFDSNGVPLAGGKIYTYSAGSDSVYQTTFTDNTGTVPNANPLVLDSSGRPTNSFWLTNGFAYHFVVTNANNTIQYQEDNVLGLTGVSSSTGLPATEVGFGSGTNQLTGTSTFTYDSSTSTLTVGGGNATISTGTGDTLTLDVSGTSVIFNTDGSINVGGGIGNSGDILTSSGSGAAPTWQPPSGGSNPTWVGRMFSTESASMSGAFNSSWHILQDQGISDVVLTGVTNVGINAANPGYYKITCNCTFDPGSSWPTGPALTANVGIYMANADSYFNTLSKQVTNQNYPNSFSLQPNPLGATLNVKQNIYAEFYVYYTGSGTLDVTPSTFVAMYSGGSNSVVYSLQMTIQLITP